uniref:Putative secreted protein n=1 Tax=Anopheles marajoara TaxID=58244 RepID=A0A2M4CCD6_9DIPT
MIEWCLRWWMSHRDSVWMLCWLLLRSSSFFTSPVSVNDDILKILHQQFRSAENNKSPEYKHYTHTTHTHTRAINVG